MLRTPLLPTARGPRRELEWRSLATLGVGLSTEGLRIKSARGPKPNQSLIQGTNGIYDENTVHPVVLRQKGDRVSSPRGKRAMEEGLQDHDNAMKRAHMRSLRAAVAREKYGGPGRSIRPKPPPPPLMTGDMGALPMIGGGGRWEEAASQGGRSPRGVGPGTTAVTSDPNALNGFFGTASASGKRVVHSLSQTESGFESLSFQEDRAGGAAPGDARSVQFRDPAAPPAAPPPLQISPAVSVAASAASGHHTTGHQAALPTQRSTNIFSAPILMGATLSQLKEGMAPPPPINLSLADTWNRNSKISKGLYKKAGNYTKEEEEQLSEASEYNEALRRLKDRLQTKGRDNFVAYFGRFDPEGEHVVATSTLKTVLKDMNLQIRDAILDQIVAGVSAAPGRVNYHALTDALRWSKLTYRSIKVPQGRFRALSIADPTVPLGGTNLAKTPFYAGGTEGAAADPASGLGARVQAVEAALKRADADNDGKVSFQEFYGALSDVSRSHRLYLGDAEIVELFRDHDVGLTARVDYKKLLHAAMRGGSSTERFPEFLRPRKERASQQQPPWVWNGAQ